MSAVAGAAETAQPKSANASRLVVVIGTSRWGRGGIASMMRTYETYGLFKKWPGVFLASHEEGTPKVKIRAFAKTFAAFVWLVLGRRVDIVHIHSASRRSFLRKSAFVLLGWIAQRPIVFQIHGGEFYRFYLSESGAVARLYIRFILRRTSSILVLSESFRRWLAEILPASDIRVLPNPVMLPELHSRGSKPIDWVPSIVFLGDLREAKGVFDLLHAAASLRQRGQKFRLTMAGKGEVGHLRPLAAKLDVAGNVSLPGWLESEARHELLQTADIFVLPSYFEAMPMSLLEAMSYGLPVIATPVGGILDVVEDGAEGFLVQPGDRDALAIALARLLDDPDLRRQMGATARRRCEEQFSINNVFPKLTKIYGELGMYIPQEKAK